MYIQRSRIYKEIAVQKVMKVPSQNFRKRGIYRERSKRELEKDKENDIENLVDKIFSKKYAIGRCYWNIAQEEYKEIICYR